MARGRIAGITIEIGGDTTKLQTALKQVDKRISDTGKALKDTNRLLKLDPSNVELLTQKQKQLEDSIAATKERLGQLKDAQGKLKEGTAEYDALQREIIETEQNLKSLEKQYKDFGSVASQQIKAAGDKIKEFGGKVKEVGQGLTTNLTVPLAAVGAASLAAFGEVDAGEDSIIKKTGATGESLEEMSGIMKDLAKSIPTDFKTAGDAVGEVSTRFGVTGDQLRDLSSKFLKFAQLNDKDVASSINSVQSALAMFGLGAEDAGTVLDILTKASQDTGVGVDELSAALSANGVALQEMGFGIGAATGFLANLDKSGVDSSAVMAGLKKALANATKEGKPMSEAMSDIGDAILNAKSDTEAAQAAVELFGSKAGPAIAQAVRDGKLSFDDFSYAVKDFGGVTESTFEATLDPADKLTTTMNALKETGADLGGVLGETLAPILDRVNEAIQGVTEKFRALSPEQQQMIVQIGLVVAALGPAVMIIGALITAIGTIVGAVGTVVGVVAPVVGTIGAIIGSIGSLQGALFLLGAVLTGPVGIVALIAAVVAAGVGLATHWDSIKQKAGELKDNISQKWSEIKQNTSQKWEEMKSTISEKISGARDKVQEKIADMKSQASSKWSDIKSDASSKFGDIKSSISEKMEGAKEKVKGAIDAIKGFFNFKVSFPHVKLPHFSVSGSANPLDWLSQGVPHISVKWYKTAMANGAILRNPAIFGMANGRLLGAGDAGAEAVIGVNALKGLIREAVAGGGNDPEMIYSAVKAGMENANIGIYIGERQLGRVLKGQGVAFI